MKATLSILVLLLLSGSALAEESLLLEDGAYGATVKAGLASGETRTYYVNAQKGQQFTAKLATSEGSGYLIVTDSQGQPLLEDLPESVQVKDVDLLVPQSGKYRIEVGAGEEQCHYILEVTLDDADSAHN